MAQSVTINCPKCKTRLMVPAESLGAKIQCPNCKVTLQTQAPKAPSAPGAPKSPAKPAAPAPSAKAPAPPAKGAAPNGPAGGKSPPAKAPAAPVADAAKNAYSFADDEEDDVEYGVNKEEDVPRCPNCAEELEDERDVICVKCGYNLRERVLYRTRKMVHKGFGDYLIWHGLAILFTILVIGLIVWNVLVFTALPGWLGGEESWGGSFVANNIFRLWNFLFSLYGVWVMGKYAVIRFFIHPHPPEEEIHNH